MTKISTRQLATLKRNAMSVYPLVAKRDAIISQVNALLAEAQKINGIIEATETGSRIITEGVNSIDLIKRVVTETGKVDAKGQPIKTTKWVPIEDRLILNEDGTYTVNYTPVSEPNEEPVNEVETKEDSNDAQ